MTDKQKLESKDGSADQQNPEHLSRAVQDMSKARRHDPSKEAVTKTKPDYSHIFPDLRITDINSWQDTLHPTNEQRNNAIQEKYGVTATRNQDGSYEYVLHANGTSTRVAQSDGSARSIESAAQKMEQMVREQKNALENEYKVKFETSSTSSYGDRVREPRLDELAGVESALSKSRASVLPGHFWNGNLSLVFLKGQEGNEPAAQNHSGLLSDRIAIFADGGWVPTEKDVTADRKISLESQLIHEMGHEAENTSSGVDYSKMGWKRVGLFDWARETKDGGLYKFDGANADKGDAAQSPRYRWFEVDNMGFPKDPTAPGAIIENKDMIERSKVRPASDYFRTPHEDFAEGIRLYRQSIETKNKFEKDSPELSRYISEFDKNETTEKFGIDDHYRPLYVRTPEGIITKNPASDGQPISTWQEIKDGFVTSVLPAIWTVVP